jgi:subtilisin family serine protease
MTDHEEFPTIIPPVDQPVQFEQANDFLIEVDDFLWVSRARQAFNLSGQGLAAAVLDTGLNTNHVDFAGRVPAQRNFTSDNGGNPDDATDGQGHGTNVAGIIAAGGDHVGLAPGANVVPLKVLGNNGSGSFQAIDNALGWVVANHAQFNIGVVCMSLGDGGNYTDDRIFNNSPVHSAMQQKIRTLRDNRVAVVIAAGNDYFRHRSQQGMSFPGIIRECVSVGALYDADEGDFSYGSGAIAHSTRAGQITPFSQRLHPRVNRYTYTDVFAPGAPVTSSGILGPHGESTQHGTSQATPVVAGLILLIQEFFSRVTGEMPTVTDIVAWLRRGGIQIVDGDDENDNVEHTHLTFVRVDALSALDAVRRELHKRLLKQAGGEV